MAKKTSHDPAAAEQRVQSEPGNAGPTNARASGSKAEKGALPSNTAPANYTNSDNGTRILRYGVDSLYLTCRGLLDKKVDARLDQLKQFAQSDAPEDMVQAVYEAGNHSFEVLGRGMGRFPFVLVDNWFHLQVSRVTTQSLPMCLVQVSSELLTRSGLKSSVSALQGVVASLGQIKSPVTVSRVDLCMDFETDIDLESIPRSAWVTRSHSFQSYWEQSHYSGCSFGLGGDISCRLYNKTLEIKKSKKTYMHEPWTEAGWLGEKTVWRLEFQLRRSVLKELRIETPVDLEHNLEGIWKYAMTSWLRLTIPDSDSNQTRREDHPLWIKLRDERWHQYPQEPLYRVSKSRVPTDERLFLHGIGSITSFMARENIEDIDEGFRAFQKEAQLYHLTQSQRTDRGLISYVREKVKVKSRKYNQLRDPNYAETRAKAYRKGKEGE
ncbi:hypothetical protein [Porticoccus hydrocarbonoclasticus]|uniref:hypothetical protein n=1 Tax=Porticoccus hydrocarbonoclasticus TaxID=1073414 RepID=UPI00068EDFFB|nr:hypothetical protein [Porticoccus hydrocarbonoclasticus]